VFYLDLLFLLSILYIYFFLFCDSGDGTRGLEHARQALYSRVTSLALFFYGYKESLLKVSEEKYKGKYGEAQVEAGSQERVYLLFRVLFFFFS
jgi:hypothetical protein